MRRTFLTTSTAVVATTATAHITAEPRRVAVIGHTGRGDYGHGLDVVWQKTPGTRIVAVADANAAGLENARRRLQVDSGFADYRSMLETVRPEFVSICPRHIDQHRDMAIAAITSGVRGLYVEKPFCRSPQEADQILAACQTEGTKLSVAHRNRYHPTIHRLDALLKAGQLGRLLEIRGRGLGDKRGGGQDLWVLGCHIMNLIHHFAGKPLSCSATMFQNGRPITAADIVDGAEGLGPLAANEVHARFEMSSGVTATYDSIANDGTHRNAYCLQLIGSEGVVTIHIDRDPLAHWSPGNPWDPRGPSRRWIPVTSAGIDQPEPRPDVVAQVPNHRLAVQDLIAACDADRQPLCSAADGAVTVDMICAVFESHRQGGRRIPFPLQQRRNALSLMRRGPQP